MLTFLRKGFILNRLSKSCLKGNSQSIGSMTAIRQLVKKRSDIFGHLGKKEMEKLQEKSPEETFIRLDLILGACAETEDKYLNFFRDKDTLKNRKRVLMARYKKIIDEVEIEELVKINNGKNLIFYEEDDENKNEKFISITGKGYSFSRPSNLLERLLNDYAKIWYLIIFILGVIISWPPLVKLIIK